MNSENSEIRRNRPLGFQEGEGGQKSGALGLTLTAAGSADIPILSLYFLQSKGKIPDVTLIH